MSKEPVAETKSQLKSAHDVFLRAASAGIGGPNGASSSGCPVAQPGAAAASSSCPVVGRGEAMNPANNMPAVSNAPVDGQAARLGTQRQASSIPTAAPNDLPQHQQAGSGVWVYPSEQMFYNAMKKKGWDPAAEDMPVVVKIHNSVNERAWQEVLHWEGLHADECGAPRLKRFQGRPADFSPKARLMNFLGYKLPFDRHDWIVDRCGTEVRYVIDFYSAAPAAGAAVGMYLDVRPALDSPGALWDRLRVQFGWAASGRWMGEKQG